jgi:hypothetical protein
MIDTIRGLLMIPETEEIRPVPGYDDLYATSEGRIIGLRCKDSKNQVWRWEVFQQYRKPSHNEFYWQVILRGRRRYVHHFIALAFIGPKPDSVDVCRHLNDVKTDNRPNNLAYGTFGDNSRDAFRNARNGVLRSFTAGQVRDIIHRWTHRMATKRQLADEHGCSPAMVDRITRGRGNVGAFFAPAPRAIDRPRRGTVGAV